MNALPEIEASAKRALITGAAQGLGRALSELLLADGWQVTAVDISHGEDQVHPALEQLSHDLSDRQSVDALLQHLANAEGFDLVVLNAAVSATGKFEKIPLEAHQRLLRLNAETPMVMAVQLAAAGKLNANARLAFVSSLSHFTGYPGAASYAASKDAIAVYAKSIRKPFLRIGVKVSCIFPGPMQTEQAERHAPVGAKTEKRMLPKQAASIIFADLKRGKARIIPGAGPGAFAWAGRLAPFVTDRIMRRIIHEKLDRETW